MSFMQHEITDRQDWIQVDGTSGIECFPLSLVPAVKIAVDNNDDAGAAILVADYYDGSQVWDVSIVSGYGGRLSASGYMDCTPWGVYDSPEEAEQDLAEMYPDTEADTEAEGEGE